MLLCDGRLLFLFSLFFFLILLFLFILNHTGVFFATGGGEGCGGGEIQWLSRTSAASQQGQMAFYNWCNPAPGGEDTGGLAHELKLRQDFNPTQPTTNKRKPRQQLGADKGASPPLPVGSNGTGG